MAVADDLATIQVSELDLTRYAAVDPGETVAGTIEAMRDSGNSCAFIVEEGRLLGVFTQRDVLMRVLRRQRVCDLPITDEMTVSPRTMRADQSVGDGLAIMREWWVRSVPVLDEEDRLIGNLSWYTVMRLMASLITSAPADDSEPGMEHGLAFVDFTGLNTSPPVSVHADDTVDVAIHHMQARAIGSVLVVDARDQLVGIVSEFDLLAKTACTSDEPSEMRVRDLMTTDVVTIAVRSPIATAIQRMAELGYSHAPLVGESSRPVGVTSFRDLAEYFETSLESLA